MTDKDNGYDDWDMKIAEWRGHVLASIEAMNKENSQLREEIKCLSIKIDSLGNRLTLSQVKLGALAATVSLITSIVLWLVTRI